MKIKSHKRLRWPFWLKAITC